MYYRLYRRRHRLIIIILIIILAIHFFINTSDSDELSVKFDEIGKLNDLAVPVKLKRRITMQNYEPPAQCRECPGENGTAVPLTKEEKNNLDSVNKKEFFNLIASSKMSLWRSLPDVRSRGCQLKKYSHDLPTASIIIVFRNENLSLILRTIYSVLNRSPRHLLVEIILVDDDSDLAELKHPLLEYCSLHFGTAVRILRPQKRLGFIAGKNYGARHASGDVIVFLEAHCEVTEGWLEPLLARIKEKPNAILCPTHDTIGDQSFAYYPDSLDYGGFSWALFFEWVDIPRRLGDIYDFKTDPYPTPTMIGLLAANRNFWFSIGGYDDGMEMMGEENLELSFRTWMCGGVLEFVPCSHVGHLYRARHPADRNNDFFKKDIRGKNSMRVAEVWMDDYKRLFYMHRPDLVGKYHGDIESRIQLRKSLKCKSFKWYLDTIFPEKFIPDEKVYAYGQIKSYRSNFCIDNQGKDEGNIIIYQCEEKTVNQFFSWSHDDEIRHEDFCLYAENAIKNNVKMAHCDGSINQKWNHTKNGAIVQLLTGLCIDASAGLNNQAIVAVQKCRPNVRNQMWQFKFYT